MVAVLVPTTVDIALPAGSELQEYRDTNDLVTRLGMLPIGTRVVLFHENLAVEEQERIAGTIRHHELDVVEVRGSGWDGFAPAPLSAACRGVISGFGAAGIGHAVTALAAV